MQRRHLLFASAAWVTAPAWCRSEWMPYPVEQTKTIMPLLRQPATGTKVMEPRQRPVRSEPASDGNASVSPPVAYVRTARQMDVPEWLLFGVALQESKMAFGERALPWPWTLCVRGKAERYRSYPDVVAALRRHVDAGVRNVDCGAMQVNWGYHRDKLQSFERALDPYPNLQVGAAILKSHYEHTGHWRTAIGLYHTGSNSSSERRARGQRYASAVLNRLHRVHGFRLEEDANA